MEIRTRIAPSPTGPMHIGLARTALFNYLFTKNNNGKMVLRIEDTDKERSEKQWEENIIEGLKWLEIDYDEGPDKGGEYGPYRQSEKTEVYRKYIEKLLEEDKAYKCYCTKEELEDHKQYQMSQGLPARYSGKCRDLTKEQREELENSGKSYVIRFRTPKEKVSFDDLLRGKIESDTENFQDMVIAKSFNEPLYNLTVAVDDYEMKISHVIRGEDHISNTPKQILLQRALGFNTPEYMHIPLILGPDRSKLSKRHGAESVIEYQEKGYLPEAMLNFLAFLGWNPGDDREVMNIQDIVPLFTKDHFQKSAAIFNVKKLDWTNGLYLRNRTKDNFTELILPRLINGGLIQPIPENGNKPTRFIITKSGEEIPFGKIVEMVSLSQERAKNLEEAVNLSSFFFQELDYSNELLVWKELTEEEVKDNLVKVREVLDNIESSKWLESKIEEDLIHLCNIEGDKGSFLWPMRTALTGQQYSPGPFEVAEALGKEKTLNRVDKAINKL